MNGQSLSLKCLASGSSGNVYLLKCGDTAGLIDCGLTAKTIAGFLKHQRVDPRSIAAILVTHEHSDHIQSVGTMSRRYAIPVVANGQTMAAITAQSGDVIPRIMPTGSAISVGELEVASFPISHDSAEPVGYLLSGAGVKVCILTDTGTVLPHLQEPVSLADVVVLESNHDNDMLAGGPYPQVLKDRVRSDKGHLSNLQAARLIAAAHTSRPQTVWLAHLSAVNNSPTHAKRTVSAYLAREGIRDVKLAVTLRDRPSLSWSSENAGWQLQLL